MSRLPIAKIPLFPRPGEPQVNWKDTVLMPTHPNRKPDVIIENDLLKIIDIEPDAPAFALDFLNPVKPLLLDAQGNPVTSGSGGGYHRGRRYEIPFHVISSELFRKSEQQLWPMGASHPIRTHPRKATRVYGSLRRRDRVKERIDQLADHLRAGMSDLIGKAGPKASAAIAAATTVLLSDQKLFVRSVDVQIVGDVAHVSAKVTAIPEVKNWVEVKFIL